MAKLPPPPKASVFTPWLRRFTDERARDLEETIELYREVEAEFRRSSWSNPDATGDFHQKMVEEITADIELPNIPALAQALDQCQWSVLELEKTVFNFPEVDFSKPLSLQEAVDLRRFLRAKQHFLSHEERLRPLLVDALYNLFGGFILELPRLAEEEAIATVPIVTLLTKPHETVDKIIGTICGQALEEAGMFTTLQQQLFENVCDATGITVEQRAKKKLITAGESTLPPIELVETYLKRTPLRELLLTPIPFPVPEATRFEHHWIVAGSGHGKTQTLQRLIAHDIERVAAGECSIVVIDSQGDLIRTIAGLKFFAENPDKLCLIDPTDIEYPVALNLFDVGMERLNTYSPLDRERLINGVLELYDFVLSALLGAEMTQKQSVIFRYVMRLMLHIPDANIQTLRELFEQGGYEKYKHHIRKLSGTARAFFENEFSAKQFETTRKEVLRRLYGILENQTFERMFSHPRNKLDLFSEMNAGKVILINTAKELLKETGTSVFGRFFLALIAQCAQERATLPPEERMPTIVYIDECQDYIANDPNIKVILEQARKQRVGMVLAHQYLTQLNQSVLDALMANTAIKFAGGVSDRDAHTLARELRTTSTFIQSQPKGFFAAHIRNVTPQALSLAFPLGYLEEIERMSVGEQRALRRIMRERYAVPVNELGRALEAPSAAVRAVTDESRERDTKRATATEVSPSQIDPDKGSHTRSSTEW